MTGVHNVKNSYFCVVRLGDIFCLQASAQQVSVE